MFLKKEFFESWRKKAGENQAPPDGGCPALQGAAGVILAQVQ